MGDQDEKPVEATSEPEATLEVLKKGTFRTVEAKKKALAANQEPAGCVPVEIEVRS